MKKITVTLTDEAEKVFNEIMYSLPKEKDGSGMCNQSEAICHALQKMWAMEQAEESTDTWIKHKIQGCDELGGMEKEKWAFQQCLKQLG